MGKTASVWKPGRRKKRVAKQAASVKVGRMKAPWQEDFSMTALALYLVSLVLMGLFAVRIIMRRRPVGVSLAWLVLIFLMPYVGILLYLLIGEVRVGMRRAALKAKLKEPFHRWIRSLKPRDAGQVERLGAGCLALHRQSLASTGLPALTGNKVDLLVDSHAIFAALIADIHASRHACNLEFYIFYPAGRVLDVAEALKAAARRGVVVRLLVDALGSRPFLSGRLRREMESAGVRVVASLRMSLWLSLFIRQDVRNHRKIAVIDEAVAYTGSFNLADPAFFKVDEGVGQWVDAMIRIEGPAVEVFEGIFLGDWEVETGRALDPGEFGLQFAKPADKGSSILQVVPSGPDLGYNTIHEIVLASIYAAQTEVVVTTPYFVPTEELQTALVSAAKRGVRVVLIVPERNDSRMVRYASRSYYQDLLEAGVEIALFQRGLLHTKSIAVDRQFSLFGSVNLDKRSFWINYEVTVLSYDREFTSQIRSLQEGYLQDCVHLKVEEWERRPFHLQLRDNAFQLLSPLL